MADQTIVNYDDLQKFEKLMQQEGEEYAALISQTRQMVQALEKDWIGSGAESFFDEFETVVLPALQRLQRSLLFTAETMQDVSQLFSEAETESGELFKEGRLEGEGGTASGIDVSDLDFGLDDFQTGQAGGSAGPGESPAANPDPGSEPTGLENIPQEDSSPLESETPSAGGGSGGSSGGSQGLQGDLEMGEGSAGQPAGQSGAAGGSTSEPMPDHVYQSSTARGADAPSTPAEPSPASSPGEDANQSGRGVAGAAGALGGAGAAAGAASKFINKDKDEDDD